MCVYICVVLSLLCVTAKVTGPHCWSKAVAASQYTAVELGLEAQSPERIPQTTASQRRGREPEREPWHPSCTGSVRLLPQFPVKPVKLLCCWLPPASPRPHPPKPGLLAAWLSCDMEELTRLHGYNNPLVREEPNEVQGWQCELPPALGTMWYWYVGCFFDCFWKEGVKALARKGRFQFRGVTYPCSGTVN